MKTAEQLARIEANKDAVATNPVLNNSRLAELTSWDAPWAGLRVVVVWGSLVMPQLMCWLRKART